MRYPQTFIDDLRRHADIVRVVSDYVTLKKKGANWMACCPFHQEKTPSFSVNPSKNIFYCFGCGKGGSIFNFVMELEGVSFPESVRVVAEKAGVPLPVMVDDKKFEARRKDADEVIELNGWALEFWERQLAAENAEARGARDEIRRKKFAILVEGYLDLIIPFQHGVRNVVARLGTALTAEQSKLLGRFARKVVVNYDGDRAGVNAAKRAIEVLLPEDFEVKVLVLPDGADPDEFVRARGVEEYNRRRGQAVPHIQFVLEHALAGRSLRNPAQKAEAVEEVLPFVRAVRNTIQRP